MVDVEFMVIGQRIKALRKSKNISVKELAEKTNLSSALVSKVENFRTLPSLTTLLVLTEALGVEMSELLKDIGQKNEGSTYTLVRKEEQSPIVKEASEGFDYRQILTQATNSGLMQCCHLTLEVGNKREKVSTDGEQIIYVLKGELDFWVGDEKVKLSKGDTLQFDGRIPHLPEAKKLKTELFVIYLIRHESSH